MGYTEAGVGGQRSRFLLWVCMLRAFFGYLMELLGSIFL